MPKYKWQTISVEDMDRLRNELNAIISMLDEKEKELSRSEEQLRKNKGQATLVNQEIEKARKEIDNYRSIQEKEVIAKMQSKIAELKEYEWKHKLLIQELQKKQDELDIKQKEVSEQEKTLDEEASVLEMKASKQHEKNGVVLDTIMKEKRALEVLDRSNQTKLQWIEEKWKELEDIMMKNDVSTKEMGDEYKKLVKLRDKIKSEKQEIVKKEKNIEKLHSENLKLQEENKEKSYYLSHKEKLLDEREYDVKMWELELQVQKKDLILNLKKQKADGWPSD